MIYIFEITQYGSRCQYRKLDTLTSLKILILKFGPMVKEDSFQKICQASFQPISNYTAMGHGMHMTVEVHISQYSGSENVKLNV